MGLIRFRGQVGYEDLHIGMEMADRLARAGRHADQNELVVADVPSNMERSACSVPGLRSRNFADFRRGGRRGVFIGQACPRSCAPANYPRHPYCNRHATIIANTDDRSGAHCRGIRRDQSATEAAV